MLTPISNIILFDTCIQLKNVIQKDTKNKSNISRRKEYRKFIFIPKSGYTFKTKANIKVVKNQSRMEYEQQKFADAKEITAK